MRKTLIINYQSTHIGGIERYMAVLAKYLISQGERVIWLCNTKAEVADSLKDIMLNSGIERINTCVNKLHWFKHDEILINREDQVVILSFSPVDYVRAESIRHYYRDFCIYNYYVVPHFTGEILYLERYFKGIFNKIVKIPLKRIIKEWESEGNIRFFSMKHAIAIESNYEIEVKDKENKLLPNIYKSAEFDYRIAKKHANSSEFNIITVSRFDFPHKGYVLGLIRAYGRLKVKYNQLSLTIIGYGPNNEDVVREINKLDEHIKKDIRLVGEVSPDELVEYFKNANLNISVAGAAIDGGRCGLISILARHYCYDCEVYGYLPDNITMILSAEPGYPVEEYIEEVINMDEEQYIARSKETYDASVKDENIDPLYFFNTRSSYRNVLMKKRDINTVKIIAYACKGIYFMKKIIGRTGSKISNTE